jgi:hypothetical protein
MGHLDHLTKKHVITIAPGTEFVLAADIPKWISEALAPIPDQPARLYQIEKNIGTAGSGVCLAHWESKDIELLEKIWKLASLPPPRGLTREEWVPYQEAFESSSDRPEWNPWPIFADPKQIAKEKQHEIQNAHYDEMERAMRDGSLVVWSDNRTIATRVTAKCVVAVEGEKGARAYLASKGFELRCAEAMQAFEALPEERPRTFTEKNRKYLTTAEMKEIQWPVPANGPKNLAASFSDPPKWMKEARESSGARGKESALWNPALFAVASASQTRGKQWASSKRLLDKLFQDELADWKDEWERLSEHL